VEAGANELHAADLDHTRKLHLLARGALLLGPVMDGLLDLEPMVAILALHYVDWQTYTPLMGNVIKFPNAQKRSIRKFTRVLDECLAAQQGLTDAFGDEHLEPAPRQKSAAHNNLHFINEAAKAAHLRRLERHRA
jgi:hypothetical protein